ncbi:MAG: hypothetical protein VR73_13800 [Gammaproteobacteria bacterium BRH_c0]|nr:MAG: hypothetical protein VR73_13800 [Gammaproteobacteria bacterium BRH_c0]
MSPQRQSFMIPAVLWERFSEQAKSLCLSIAPFLDHVISHELEHVSADLKGLRNNNTAKRVIGGELKRVGSKSVNIAIEPSTIERLNAVIEEHNIARNALISRILLFLRCPDVLCNILEIPEEVEVRYLHLQLEGMPTAPMSAMRAVYQDPFFYLRHYVQANWGEGLYRVELPAQLNFAACYLSDEDNPRTAQFKKKQKLNKEMMALIGNHNFGEKK